MSDKTIFGCAETGTYQTSSPNPHIELSGTASSDYSIAQLFADAMSTDDKATISVIKDKDNWAVYSGVKFTNASPDTLDLSVATLQESKGTLSDEDAVTCLGLAPGSKGVGTCRVYLNSAQNSPSNSTAKINFDTTSWDTAGIWDSGNKRFLPTVAGYYRITARAKVASSGTVVAYLYKNGSIFSVISLNGVDDSAAAGSCLVEFNGSTDYAEIYVYTNTAKAYANSSSESWAEIIGPLAT